MWLRNRELQIRWQCADAADARHTESPSFGAGPSPNGTAGCELWEGKQRGKSTELRGKGARLSGTVVCYAVSVACNPGGQRRIITGQTLVEDHGKP